MIWNKFYWTEEKNGENYIKKLAIMIPINISGCSEKLYAQLDTGADSSFFSGPALKHLPDSCRKNIDLTPHRTFKTRVGITATEEWTIHQVTLNLSLGNSPATAREVAYSEDYGKGEGDFSFGEGPNKGIAIGTVGMDVFQDKQLVIDFPRERFMVLNNDDPLPQDLAANIDYTSVSIMNGKVYLPLIINSETTEVMFDTGTSRCTLLTTKVVWQRLTGRSGDETTNTVIEASAWDYPVRMVGAKLREKLSIGDNKMSWDEKSGIEVFFLDSKNEFSVNVVGNALFYEDSIIVLDLYKKRFGRIRAFNGMRS